MFLGTHCIDPPLPEASKDIVYHENVNVSALTEFGETVQYVCRPGHFFTDDRDKTEEELTCEEGNIWNGTLGKCWKSSCFSCFTRPAT